MRHRRMTITAILAAGFSMAVALSYANSPCPSQSCKNAPNQPQKGAIVCLPC